MSAPLDRHRTDRLHAVAPPRTQEPAPTHERVSPSWDEVPLRDLAQQERHRRRAWSFACLFAGGAALAGCSFGFPQPSPDRPEGWGSTTEDPVDDGDADLDDEARGHGREDQSTASGDTGGDDSDAQRERPDDPHGAYDGSAAGSGGDEPLEPWGDAVVTLYTFQDNSACNSMMTATGLPLVPYLSVALPFRFLTDFGGGPLSLGETIHVSFLQGRTMPDSSTHTGWVQIDDYCGDHGDDSYCLQGGLPNVDLYIGDWATSGMRCDASDLDDGGSGGFSGPAGDGHEPTTVSFGPAPAGALTDSYGGNALGEGDCGDCAAARDVQPPACWHYDPGDTNVQYCDCDNSNGRHGECD